MKQQALPQFESERTRFRLRFTCEHCTYFHVEHEACTHGYPNAEHRESRYQPSEQQALPSADTQTQVDTVELVFCKEFELR